MSEGNAEVERRLQEMHNSIRDLRSAMGRARTMRVLGTLAVLVIAVVYAILFITHFKRSFAAERVHTAVTRQMQNPEFKLTIDRLSRRARAEVLPEFQKALQQKAAELKLQEAVVKEVPRVAAKVMPVLVSNLREKAAELELTPVLAKEFGALMTDVGPVYMAGARETLEELGLMDEFTKAMKEHAEELSGAYRKELHRIAPEVMDALKQQQDELAQELSTWLEQRLRTELEASLRENQEYIQQQTDLEPEAVKEKLAGIVVAADEAIKGMVRARTDRFQGDLNEINKLLAQVPLASEKDPDRLVDEMVRVLIQLLKEKIPAYESPLEWEEGV